ncbi:site-specific integrase [Cryptosporangium phraense]|uniref:Site-specific integrase n=1 Tax=Cryptosporangium phraense TaxID=2593070 RepID=A0A545ANE8_9ACTN|nr:site-specific integrase [Cryptosporangium phraense]TQS42816.1 site-specific integrase [Cryptosporangium phraense]
MSTTSGTLSKQCSCRGPDGRKLGTRCPKLRRAGGTWSPTHGRWSYQRELPADPDRPGRRQLRNRTFAERQDAADELQRVNALLALAAGDPGLGAQIATLLLAVPRDQPMPDRDVVARRIRAGVAPAVEISTGQYLTDWLATRKLKTLTLRSYAGHIRNHLIPHLGHIPVDKLRVEHLQAMVAAIEDRTTGIEIARQSDDPEVRASVKGVPTTGPATLHRIRATLRKALNDAIRVHRLIEFNPAAHLELPPGRRPKARVWTAPAVAAWLATGARPSPVMVWTPAQAGRFLDFAEEHDPDLVALYTLTLHRGPRRGEVVGLPESQLDLDARLMMISTAILVDGYTTITDAVKSQAGDRPVPLDQVSVGALRRYFARRAEWKLAAGPDWPDTGLVFVRPDGRPWHPELVSERFEKLVARAGLPPIRFHDLRHCAATYMKAAGSDLKDIQEVLGHSGIAITGDTYTSVIFELETEMAKADAAAALIPRARAANGPTGTAPAGGRSIGRIGGPPDTGPTGSGTPGGPGVAEGGVAEGGVAEGGADEEGVSPQARAS